jgi:nitric oxide reductase NorQ protein
VISYNPGYQSTLKDLKQSTRQRFMAIDFGYPSREQEAQILQHESGVDEKIAFELAKLGEKVRHLKGNALVEGVSTRLLVYAGKLIKEGIPEKRACEIAVGASITDEEEIQKAVAEVISAIFP